MNTEDYFFVVTFLNVPPSGHDEEVALALLKDLAPNETQAVQEAVELEVDDFRVGCSEARMEPASEACMNLARYLVFRRQVRETEEAMLGKPHDTLKRDRLYRTALAAIEHAKQVRELRGAPERKAKTLVSFEVIDAQTQKRVAFDATSTESWGPVDEPEDGEDLRELSERDELTLYRHPNGHWTLLTKSWHLEFGSLGVPRARRLTDEEAVDWLVRHGREPPSDVAHLAKNSFFVPGPPSPTPTLTVKQPTPVWNKDLCELTYRGTVIRQVKRPKVAKNVVRVLDAFQEDGWPDRIDDPLAPSKNQQRLHETIKRLNDNLDVIRFRSDGTGQGIVWELTAPEPPQESLERPF
jgi:hypothetical protein